MTLSLDAMCILSLRHEPTSVAGKLRLPDDRPPTLQRELRQKEESSESELDGDVARSRLTSI